jgi:hypothetical protein
MVARLTAADRKRPRLEPQADTAESPIAPPRSLSCQSNFAPAAIGNVVVLAPAERLFFSYIAAYAGPKENLCQTDAADDTGGAGLSASRLANLIDGEPQEEAGVATHAE